jgi:hypothetical protein
VGLGEKSAGEGLVLGEAAVGGGGRKKLRK